MMSSTFLRPLVLSACLVIVAAGAAFAQDCSGTITADEATKVELARYAAQTANDFAAMEKMFGNDLSSGLEFVSWQSTGIPAPRQ